MRPIRNILTFYDQTTKVWSGLPKASIFNPYPNVADLVFEMLKRNGDKVVQISADSGVELTGAELRQRAIRIAQNLVKMGFGSGEDTFTMAVRNGEHTAPAVFACFALGIPVNTLDATFLRDDLNHMLATVRPKLVFCDSETLTEMVAACQLTALNPKIILMGDHVDGFVHVDQLLQPTGCEETFTRINIPRPAEHLAIMVCSSGTTGRSKAVGLSHSICIAQVANFLDCLPTDRTFAFSSLYWLSGVMILLASTVWGATRIITRQLFDPKLTLDIVERFRVCIISVSTSQAYAIVNCPKATISSFASIRLLICGGTPVSTALKISFEKMIPGQSLQITYGLTEIGTAVSFSSGNVYRDGSVGFLRPGMKLKIVNDDGDAMDIGQEGEILIWAKFVFSGYYGNEAASSDILDSEGWLHTGDIGRVDEDGFLYVVDRKKDIMDCSGVHVSPSEIESVIQTIPGVVGVCVIGVLIESTEWPAAMVVLADGSSGPDEAELIQKVETSFPSYKHLRGGVYFVQQLPMTPSGKVLRRVVREMGAKGAVEFESL